MTSDFSADRYEVGISNRELKVPGPRIQGFTLPEWASQIEN